MNHSTTKQSYDTPNYALSFFHTYLENINNKSQEELIDFTLNIPEGIKAFLGHPEYKSEFEKFYTRVRAHIFEQGEDGATWIKKRFSQMEKQLKNKRISEDDPKRIKALEQEMNKINILLDEWNIMLKSKQYGNYAQQLTSSIDETSKLKAENNETMELYYQGLNLDKIINNKSESGLKLFINDIAVKIKSLKSDPSQIKTYKKYSILYSRANNALAVLPTQKK